MTRAPGRRAPQFLRGSCSPARRTFARAESGPDEEKKEHSARESHSHDADRRRSSEWSFYRFVWALAPDRIPGGDDHGKARRFDRAKRGRLATSEGSLDSYGRWIPRGVDRGVRPLRSFIGNDPDRNLSGTLVRRAVGDGLTHDTSGGKESGPTGNRTPVCDVRGRRPTR